MSARRRKVLLDAFDVDRDKNPKAGEFADNYSFMSVANGSLLASLTKAGRDWSFLSPVPDISCLPDDFADAEAQRILNLETPEDVDVAFGVYVWNDYLIRQIVELLRVQDFRGRIVLGGPQITWAPKGQLETLYPGADVFVRGEAEEAFVRLTETADPVSFPGVHYRGEQDDGCKAEANLADLPSPFLDQPLSVIPVNRTFKARWETKRGCPYACYFCQHRGSGGGPRLMAEERIEAEIRVFVKEGVRKLTVVDPIFNVGKTYIGILDQLRNASYAGELSLQCRFERVEDGFLDRATAFDVCLEFGLQTANAAENNAIGHRYNEDTVRGMMKKLRDRNLHFEVDLIYGLPCQTLDSFKRSVEFCYENEVPRIRAWPLMLLRGTKLASKESREKWGFRENNNPIPLVISSNSFSTRDWEAMKGIAEKLCPEKAELE